jgi:hypothetical protein
MPSRGKSEPTKGFEPPTRALRKRCSTPELRRLAPTEYINRQICELCSGGLGAEVQAELRGFFARFFDALAAHAMLGLTVVAVQLLGGRIGATTECTLPVHEAGQ